MIYYSPRFRSVRPSLSVLMAVACLVLGFDSVSALAFQPGFDDLTPRGNPTVEEVTDGPTEEELKAEADRIEADANAEPDEEKPPLPAGVVLPQAVPEVMTLEKSLVDDDAVTEFANQDSQFGRSLRGGELRPEDQELVSLGLKVKILQLSDPAVRTENRLGEVKDDIAEIFEGAGKFQRNARKQEQFREYVLGEGLGHLESLMDNNFYVRANAVILIAGMNRQEAGLGTQAAPYLPAAAALTKVLEDAEQHPGIKILAARGLARFLADPELPPADRRGAASALVDIVLDNSNHYWLQKVAIHSLAYADLYSEASAERKPFILDALSKALVDPKRPYLVRAEAAWALGRIPLRPEVNVSLLVHEIVELASTMAKAQRQRPQAFYWTPSFEKLYLAFRPTNEAERNRNSGLLTKLERGEISETHKNAIDSAYPLIVALTKTSIKNGPQALPEKLGTDLDGWLQANPATSPNRLTPALQPLAATTTP